MEDWWFKQHLSSQPPPSSQRHILYKMLGSDRWSPRNRSHLSKIPKKKVSSRSINSLPAHGTVSTTGRLFICFKDTFWNRSALEIDTAWHQRVHLIPPTCHLHISSLYPEEQTASRRFCFSSALVICFTLPFAFRLLHIGPSVGLLGYYYYWFGHRSGLEAFQPSQHHLQRKRSTYELMKAQSYITSSHTYSAKSSLARQRVAPQIPFYFLCL